MGLIRRLESFPGRALVVVGPQETADLETVRIALDFVPTNTTVAVLWPSDVPIPESLGLPSRLDIHFLRGTRAELIDAFIEVGVPKPSSSPRLGIRYGRSTLDIQEEDLVGIDQEFILIRDSDFGELLPDDVDVERLWRSEPNDWLPFASEMVFRRHYRPFTNFDMDLAEYVISDYRVWPGETEQ